MSTTRLHVVPLELALFGHHDASWTALLTDTEKGETA